MEPTPATYFRYIGNKSFNDIHNGAVPIRTLYIASYEAIKRCEIYGFFNQFGDIEFVNWHQINQTQYGFVQFKTTKGAEAALQYSDYRFGTTLLNVMAAKPWHQPDFPAKLKQNLENNADYMQCTQNDCPVSVRTLYIASNKPIMIQRIRSHFESFGEIECGRWHSINGYDYGFVQFMDVKCAEHALSQPLQMCGDVVLKVAIANKYFQPDSTHINTLNDDCLRHVLQYLDTSALAAFIDVYIHFKQHSHEIFLLMQSVSVHNESSLDLITIHCLPTQLKELVCKNITFSNKLMESLNPFLATLKKLHLIGCEFDQGSADALPTSMMLDDLRISPNKYYFSFDPVTISEDGIKIVNDLVKLNTDLKKFALGHYDMHEPSALKNQNYTNLIELELGIKYGSNTYCSMRELSSLKVLKLDTSFQPIVPLLEKMSASSPTIDHLELFCTNFIFKPTNFQLKQIKTLKLWVTRADVDIFRFLPMVFPELHTLYVNYFIRWPLTSESLRVLLLRAKKLSILKIIQRDSPFYMDISDHAYDEMLQIIQERVENNSVLIDIESDRCSGRYRKRLRITNPDCLNIRVKEL